MSARQSSRIQARNAGAAASRGRARGNRAPPAVRDAAPAMSQPPLVSAGGSGALSGAQQGAPVSGAPAPAGVPASGVRSDAHAPGPALPPAQAEVNWSNRHGMSVMQVLSQQEKHFSKIVSRFTFENNRSAYLAWCKTFTLEMERTQLAPWLKAIRVASATGATASEEYQKEVQRVLYHMVVQCVSADALSVVRDTLDAEHRTGKHAWDALRLHYIGNEETFMQGLEQNFAQLQWLATEDFQHFTVRMLATVSELKDAAAPGSAVTKPDHLLKHTVMQAIESAGRVDANKESVFGRLNNVNMIHADKPFLSWLTAMRSEAQKIQESLSRKRGMAAAGLSSQTGGDGGAVNEVKEANKVEVLLLAAKAHADSIDVHSCKYDV
jgi:hypothetical protein